MLSLPSKPWKKIKIDHEENNRYVITFISRIEHEVDFHKTLHDDLELCISGDDALSDACWETKSVVLTTEDFALFKKRLVYVCIMIEND